MSEPSGSRPRPKPRPRPRPPVVAPPPPAIPTLVEAPSSPTAQWQKEVDDEDALFMRNRSRTTKTWKQLEELDKLATRYSATDTSSDDGEASSPRSRKGKKKSAKDVALPNWTRSNDIVRMLSEDHDDDALQEIENTPKGKRSDLSPLKRKRQRSHSRSITPPPAVPIHQIQNVRNIVRQTLHMAPRAPSPTLVVDELNETVPLDPELAQIAQAVRNQSYQSQSFTAESTHGGPEVVTIRVRWQPHPLNDASRPMIWAFKMKRHDPFRLIFEETADMAAILFEDLIVCFQNNRVFPSATPHNIKIWAEADLEACNKITYDYLRTQRHKSPAAPEHDNLPDDSTTPQSPDGDSAADSDAESVGGEKFKLTLRSAVSTITLTVRPTTTCGAIVNAFLKSAGLAANYATTSRHKNQPAGPRLQIDGEKMNPAEPIGNAGLEDGDCVDVVDL